MTDRSAPEGDVLTVTELRLLLRRGRRQTYDAIRSGEIPGCHKLGRRTIRCSRVAIERWLHGRHED